MPKKIKIIKYTVPKNRFYLFVNEPWPFDESVHGARNRQGYINAVVAWILCMIQDVSDVDVDQNQVQVFWQSKHRDLIIEIQLPPNTARTSMEALLGAHHSSDFMTPEYAGDGNRVSIIFEYDYVRCNAPEKRSWTSETAAYESLPDNFAIRRDGKYPAPRPVDPLARTQTVQKWAKALPETLIVGNPACVQREANPLPSPPPPAAAEVHRNTGLSKVRDNSVLASRARSRSRSPYRSPSRSPPQSPTPPPPVHPSEFAFTPYERASHLPLPTSAVQPSPEPGQRPFSIKYDPYEEEASARASLSAHPPQAPRHGGVKEELQDDDMPTVSGANIKPEPEMEERRHAEQLRAPAASSSPSPSASLSGARGVKQEPRDDDGVSVKVEVKTEPGTEPGIETEEEKRARESLRRITATGRELVESQKPPQLRTVKVEVKTEPGMEIAFETEEQRQQREALREITAVGREFLERQKAQEAQQQDVAARTGNAEIKVKPEPRDVTMDDIDWGTARGIQVKPEPGDVVMPPLPPRNRRFDPFAGYGEVDGDASGGGVKSESGDVPMPGPSASVKNEQRDDVSMPAVGFRGVKREPRDGEHFNTRTPHAASFPVAYPGPPPPRVKREEPGSHSRIPPSASNDGGQSAYSRRSMTYASHPPRSSSGVKREGEADDHGFRRTNANGSGQASLPVPSSYNHSSRYPPPGKYQHGKYTPPGPRYRPVKRERDDDPSLHPPLKREREDSRPPPQPNMRDPRVRARFG